MMEKPILLTGATGYVSGRLIPALLDAGYRRTKADPGSYFGVDRKQEISNPFFKPGAG